MIYVARYEYMIAHSAGEKRRENMPSNDISIFW